VYNFLDKGAVRENNANIKLTCTIPDCHVGFSFSSLFRRYRRRGLATKKRRYYSRSRTHQNITARKRNEEKEVIVRFSIF